MHNILSTLKIPNLCTKIAGRAQFRSDSSHRSCQAAGIFTELENLEIKKEMIIYNLFKKQKNWGRRPTAMTRTGHQESGHHSLWCEAVQYRMPASGILVVGASAWFLSS
jgi:hypothetical protein